MFALRKIAYLEKEIKENLIGKLTDILDEYLNPSINFSEGRQYYEIFIQRLGVKSLNSNQEAAFTSKSERAMPVRQFPNRLTCCILPACRGLAIQ
ncbi:MAG: hypothetical protein ACU84H_05120 [Gammaproteobacteria bacterium]